MQSGGWKKTKIRRTRGEQEERTSRTVSRLSLERLADRETGMICKATRSPMQDCRNCLIALNTLIASCQLSVIGLAPSRLYHGVDGLENRVAQSCRLFIAIFTTNFRRSPKVLFSLKKTINACERELSYYRFQRYTARSISFRRLTTVLNIFPSRIRSCHFMKTSDLDLYNFERWLVRLLFFLRLEIAPILVLF